MAGLGSGKRGDARVKVQTVIYDNRYGKTYDISKVTSDMTITTYLDDTPGKLEFTVRAVSPLAFWEGATVSVMVDGYGIYKGFVFKKKRNEDARSITVTCFDQMRYLKNKDSAVFEGVTSAQIFSTMCDKFALKFKVVDQSSHVCAPRSEDAVTIYEMIKRGMDDTLINTGEQFFIRDNFGVLEHKNVKSCYRPEVLGDKSFVTGFDYETSIDKDVYTQIKLYRDNQTTGKRDLFVVNDTVNGGQRLKEWGILQLYQKIDESYNEAQIEARALAMLKFYCSTRRSLTLKCLGIKEFYAGCIFKAKIKDLGDLSLDDFLLVQQCTHKFKNEEHTMELKVEIVR